MINTIIFDLAEVYLKGVLDVEHYLEPILNIKHNEILDGLGGDELNQLFKGEISEEKYWEEIIKKNNWDISINDLKINIRKNFQEIKGTREIIENLKNQGYRLGLLSVHCKEWVEHCNKKFDYHKLFHSTLYSFEIGLLKPEKKVYQEILNKLGKSALECLFIDDSENNIKAAKELGINTIHFRNAEQLKIDLEKYSISVGKEIK